ncbi:MAG: hypothetical protein WDA16_04035 [Candidatus Thermoplasmatota archaeon]
MTPVAPGTTKAPVLVPFLCPICAAPNAVHLVTLSRQGIMPCVACHKKLRAADVMRALHTPRKA